MELSIGARWETVRSIVLEKNRTVTELVELKRCFYAGAFGMLTNIKIAAELPEAEACQLMGKLEAELKAFERLLGTPAEL